jgi:hypothetical protein
VSFSQKAACTQSKLLLLLSLLLSLFVRQSYHSIMLLIFCT